MLYIRKKLTLFKWFYTILIHFVAVNFNSLGLVGSHKHKGFICSLLI